MSWREVLLCPVVSLQAMMKGKEREDRMKWEIARWQSFKSMQLSPFIKDFARPKTAYQYSPFPWETEPVVNHEPVELTEAQVSELFRITSALNNNKTN